MLERAENVPHTLIGTVHGVGGTWVGADVPEDLLDLATVWSGGPCGMAEAKLDLAGVIRLRELLGEVAAAMLAAECGGISATTCAIQAVRAPDACSAHL